MITVGVVLLLIGALVAYFGRPREQVVYAAGLLIAAVGAVLLLIGLLDTADAHDAHTALLPLVGGLGVAGAGKVAPGNESHPASGGSLKDRRPVLLGFIVAATPVVCAFVLQVLEATDVLNNALWLRTLLTGLGALIGALATLWAQSKVTPVAIPQTDEGEPLVPVSDPIVTGAAPVQAPTARR